MAQSNPSATSHARPIDGLSWVRGDTDVALSEMTIGALLSDIHGKPQGRHADPSQRHQQRPLRGAVYQIPSGVAVVGKGFWPAKKGRDALVIEWDPHHGERLSSDTQRGYYAKLLDLPGTPARSEGDVAAATRTAAKTLTADYHFPYMAHATMEPLGANVEVKDDSAEIWVSTQWPGGNQQVAAALLGLKPEQVKVHSTLTGGGFGRRSCPGHDFVREAVLLGKAARALKAPIKVIWTRDDDIRGGAYRPAAATRLTATLDADGNITSFSNRVVVQSIGATTPFKALIVHDGVDHLSVEGSAVDLPYAVPNISADLHTPDYGVPVTWMRSVGHSFNAYGIEVFIDELAAAAGKDTYEFRRALLQKQPRHLGVLDPRPSVPVGTQAPAGVFRGIAVHGSYRSHVATVVEASVSPKRELSVSRVIVAIDCGIAINPDLVAAQMESSVVFGLTSAYFGEITLKKGVVEQSNFDDYALLRMYQTPKIEVIVIDAEPQGVADEVVRIVSLAAGQRPARTVIDYVNDGAAEVIEVAERVRIDFAKRIGIDDLLHLGGR